MPAGQPAAIVFAAAPLDPTPRLRTRLSRVQRPFVVAADRGATTALAFGYEPDVVVGDLDSIDPATAGELRRRGVPIEEHPRDKDATDGQLAVERALRVQPSELILLGFVGGPRLDQTLANVLLLVGLATRATLFDQHNECLMLRSGGEYSWRTETGEIISLLPMNGAVDGVRTSGLRWPVRGETLRLGDTRGVSNEAVTEQASVSIERGLLVLTRHFPPPTGI